jgi:hypothetical protein
MTLPISAAETNRTLEVWRPTLVDDGYGGGGKTVTLIEQTDPVRAMVSEPTAAERVAAMQAGSALTITVELVAADDGDRLRVKATVIPSTPVYLRADCEQIQTEGGTP